MGSQADAEPAAVGAWWAGRSIVPRCPRAVRAGPSRRSSASPAPPRRTSETNFPSVGSPWRTSAYLRRAPRWRGAATARPRGAGCSGSAAVRGCIRWACAPTAAGRAGTSRRARRAARPRTPARSRSITISSASGSDPAFSVYPTCDTEGRTRGPGKARTMIGYCPPSGQEGALGQRKNWLELWGTSARHGVRLAGHTPWDPAPHPPHAILRRAEPHVPGLRPPVRGSHRQPARRVPRGHRLRDPSQASLPGRRRGPGRLGPRRRPTHRTGGLLQDVAPRAGGSRARGAVTPSPLGGGPTRAASLPGAGPSAARPEDLRVRMPRLPLGLPDAGGYDHRPVEARGGGALPLRDVLLRPQSLRAVSARTDAQGARAQGCHVGGGGLGGQGRHRASHRG